MPERWDSLYVDRIESTGRIFLMQPQEYGVMYKGQAETSNKVRKSIPRECGYIKGCTNENKILIATAIATALNRKNLESSKGLIVRGFKGRTAFPGLQTALIKTRRESLRVKGSTGWIVYISPAERFYSIVNGKYKGEELTEHQSKMIHNCIDYIENEWG